MEKEISLKDIFIKLKEIRKFLISKWKLIFLFGFLGGLIGLYLSFQSIKTYKSELTFVLEEDSKGADGLSSLASSFGIGGVGEEGGLYTKSNLLEFLKSRNLVEKTLLKNFKNNKLNETFVENYLKEYKMKQNILSNKNPEIRKIKFLEKDKREKFTVEKDSILQVIYNQVILNDLTISQPNEDNSFILIKFKNRNQFFAKEFPIKLLEIATEYYVKTKTLKQEQNLLVLQRQVDSVRNELNSSLVGVASATDNVFGLNPSMNVKRIPSVKKQVDVQANTAILTELIKNLELTKMNLLNQTPLIQIIDEPILPLKSERLGKIKATLIGGIISGLLFIFFLLIRRYLKKVMN